MKSLTCTPILLPLSMPKASPKECVGMIFKNSDKVLSIIKDLDDVMKSNSYFGAEPQHLYFVSTREIKKGDYFIDDDILTPLTKICKCVDSNYGKDYDSYIKDESGTRIRGFHKCHKIEATTNQSLGLPLIDADFIEKYVAANGNIKEVAIEMHSDYNLGHEPIITYQPKLKDGFVIIHQKDSWNKEDLLNLLDYYENKRQYFMEKAYDGETILKYWGELNLTK